MKIKLKNWKVFHLVGKLSYKVFDAWKIGDAFFKYFFERYRAGANKSLIVWNKYDSMIFLGASVVSPTVPV